MSIPLGSTTPTDANSPHDRRVAPYASAMTTLTGSDPPSYSPPRRNTADFTTAATFSSTIDRDSYQSNPPNRAQTSAIAAPPPREYFAPSYTGIEKLPIPAPTRRVEFARDDEVSPPIHDEGIRGSNLSETPEAVLTPYPTNVLPRRPPKLKRGLQIPSRMGIITSGFSLPPALEARGVTMPQWKLFTHELKRYARFSKRQLSVYVLKNVGIGLYLGFFLGVLGVIPGSIIGYKIQKESEHRNLVEAHESGALEMFVARWNEQYFEQLGMHVMIALPESVPTTGMDVSTTTLYQYQQDAGVEPPAMAGGMSREPDRKEMRHYRKEGRQRVRACRKGRIVVIPFEKPVSGVVAVGDRGKLVRTDTVEDSDRVVAGENTRAMEALVRSDTQKKTARASRTPLKGEEVEG